MKDKRIIILIILILVSIITLIGSSYALLTKSFKGDKLSMQVGTLKIDFAEGNSINLNNAIPISDTDGLATTPYTFTITNSGSIDAYYTVSNEEDSSNTLDTSYLKMKITSDDGYDSGIVTLKSLGSKTYRIVDERNLKTNKAVTYKLYLWISSEALNDIQDKTYKSKIVVNSTSNRVGDTYCLDNGFTTLSDCMLVMNSHEVSVDSAKSNIKAKGTPDFSQTATTDEGLYMTEDDEGESYYYRGAVKNNYVSFAGFIWRIIRRNGDGSIRLIYSGKSTSGPGEIATIGKSAYNEKYWDPTYVGYRYNEDFSLHENNSSITYANFVNNEKYYFGSGYIFNETTKKFTLTGEIKQLTWQDNHEEIVKNQLYSCFATNCNILYKVTEYLNDVQVKAIPITYSSNSLLSAQTNKTDSIIKTILDNWYKTNMTNYTSKLVDETFCNDRSVSSGNGYTTDLRITYGAYSRLIDNKKPSLKCSQANDKFRVSNTSAKLDYPIGLITADEVALAGGVLNIDNNKFYLHIAFPFWTFSPSAFATINTHAYNCSLDGVGDLDWHYTNGKLGVRPVINLKSDIQITKGDGTTLNPYTVS